jgi:hypothetical protein
VNYFANKNVLELSRLSFVKTALMPSLLKKTLSKAAQRLYLEFTSLCSKDKKNNLLNDKKYHINFYIEILQVEKLLQVLFLNADNKDIARKICEITGAGNLDAALKIFENWKKKYLQRYGNKEVKDETETEFTFDDLIVEVSRWLGYPIDRKRTTVLEFAGMLNAFNRHLTHQNKKNVCKK